MTGPGTLTPPVPRTDPRRHEITELHWRRLVLEIARDLEWKWLLLTTAADGALGRGWPDITLARERIVFLNLRPEDGILRPRQVNVRDHLCAAGAEYHLLRPSQLQEVRQILERRGPPG